MNAMKLVPSNHPSVCSHNSLDQEADPGFSGLKPRCEQGSSLNQMFQGDLRPCLTWLVIEFVPGDQWSLGILSCFLR